MKKAIRIIAIIAIAGIFIAAITATMSIKPANSDRVWDQQTTVGNLDAKNYFIIYSDLVCPYCIAFENAIVEHEEDFQNYIAENDILVEVRVSDFLYEFGNSQPINSRYSAIATYCAKSEGKFWDYYNLAVSTVWNDYFKDLGKSAYSKMSNLDKSYWIKIGEKIGLSESFKTCVNNDTPLEEIEQNAAKTAKLADGMPYFKFNNFTNSGFDLSWGWDRVQMYFQAGLENR